MESRIFEGLYTQITAGISVIDMDRSDEGSSDPEARRRAEWVSKLRSGDVISVVPRACPPGVEMLFASVHVYTACHLS